MNPSSKSALEFISAVPNETRKKDGLSVVEMMQQITGLEPVRWGPSIIGFGKYVHRYDSGRETSLPLVSFSPRKQHLVFYVLNGFSKQEELLSRLGKHKTGNICLYINKLTDVDMDVLKQIIELAYDKNLIAQTRFNQVP